MNKCIFIGNLTRDPELKTYTNSEKVENYYLTETLAVNAPKTSSGEQQTIFIDFKIWGKRAETFSKFTAKGSKVCIEGAYTINSYTSQDGTNKKSYFITVENFEFLSLKPGGENQTSSKPKKQVQKQNEMQFEITDEDLPF